MSKERIEEIKNSAVDADNIVELNPQENNDEKISFAEKHPKLLKIAKIAGTALGGIGLGFLLGKATGKSTSNDGFLGDTDLTQVELPEIEVKDF